MSSEQHVIVGAGHAARRAAEVLRAGSETLEIVMIGDEPHPPYDRPALSKEALLQENGERRAFIRDADWYVQNKVDVRLSRGVTAIDRTTARVHLDDGTTLPYDRLLLATGSRVRTFSGPVDPDVPLYYVRTLAQAVALRAALAPGKHVAVLGAGFIGLEVAAAARQRGCTVTVVEPATGILQRSLPLVAADYVERLHRRNDVQFMFGATPTAIRRRDARVVVTTTNGELEADIVVVGIGVIPNVELASAAGLEVDNGIVVDAQCRTRDDAIFAAGEVTRHYNPLMQRAVRIESWQVAENQPAVAAANMLGGTQVYAEWPWLWSDQYDCNIQTVGMIDPANRLVLRGNVESGPLCVMALDEVSRVRAMVAINAGRDVGAAKRLIASEQTVDAAQLADSAVPLRSLLAR